MSIKNQAISGTKWATFATIISALIQLLQTIILTRYLDKESVGLMALAMTVIGISQVFVDFGISNAIIQKQNISETQLSTLYWFNILMGITIYFSVLLLSDSVASYYKKDELSGILNLIGLTFMIQPFAQQYEILMQKKLMFKPIAISVFVSRVLGLLFSLILLVYDFKIYSIVYSNIAIVVVHNFLIFSFGRKLYRPKFIFSYASIMEDGLVTFGLYQMGAKLVFILATQFDVFIIGKVLGFRELGVYNVSKILSSKCLEFLTSIFTKITFPVLSKVQENSKLLLRTYFDILKIEFFFVTPIFCLIALFSNSFINILFGSEWLEAEDPLKWLCLAGFAGCLWHSVAILWLSIGKAKEDLLGNAVLVILVPVAVFVGSPFGILGVASSIGITRIIFSIVSWGYSMNKIFLSRNMFTKLFRAIGWSTVSSLVIFLILSQVIKTSFAIGNYYLNIGLYSLVFLGLYIFIISNKDKTSIYFIKKILKLK